MPATPVPAAATARTSSPVRIFSVPQVLPSGDTADESFLDQVVENWERFQAKGDPRFPMPPAYMIPAASIGLGHDEDQQLARSYSERSDLPAIGWPTRIYRDGKFLMAEAFEGVPVKLAEWINAGAYQTCSSEFYEPDYMGFGPVFRRVSILGAAIPVRKDLGKLPVMVFDPDATNLHNPVAFCERFPAELAAFALSNRGKGGFQLRLPGPGLGRLVTFGESLVGFGETIPAAVPSGVPKMTPQQQAILAALVAAIPGLDVSKIDGAALDAIANAVAPTAPAVAAEGDETPADEGGADDAGSAVDAAEDAVTALDAIAEDAATAAAATAAAVGTETTEPAEEPAAMAAKFSERLTAGIVAGVKAAMKPVHAELATIKKQVGSATGALAATRREKDRVEIAAFCEKHKDKIFPSEMDAKVGPTLVDQLLALPSVKVATFAEGKTSLRAAAMKAIENRPAVAKYAERIAAPVVHNDAASEAAAILALTPTGRAAVKHAEKLKA